MPGKVMLPVAGRPLLAWQIARLRQSRLIDRIIVATSEHAQDDTIVEMAAGLGAEVYRGSETDVLGRVASALRAFDVDIHVECHGDNAACDAMLFDSIIGLYLKVRSEFDYVTTARKTTFPPGSNVTVYAAEALYRAEANWDGVRSREHVGTHIYQRPDLFRVLNVEAPPALRFPQMHFEVDTAEDYGVIQRLYDHFLPDNPYFSLAEAIAYAKSTGLTDANRDVPRRWRAYRED